MRCIIYFLLYTETYTHFWNKFILENNIVVQVAEIIVMSSELMSDNTNVRWFRDDVELGDGLKSELKKHGVNCSLAVKSADLKDSGTCSCHLKNVSHLCDRLHDTVSSMYA